MKKRLAHGNESIANQEALIGPHLVYPNSIETALDPLKFTEIATCVSGLTCLHTSSIGLMIRV